ncbi:MAG: hypothetical protein EA344_05165 [Alkalicoccus sp.]|jgi:hypothetical protein|uniref:Uncharacterized protein n=1 Tax=Alkalicoccus saliphilus TaxID=200989 RepID=A0A2T4U2U5_9BACI|nr:hypothetical protein [Alkalicoccus saliphilus]PTL37716.1 hypothetical protein C6Y45_14960 [Alkalicoccus saliphilus]TVP85168.1 MAG: hypothetical protein EA344_05165 [Alkalicoccus sp.]
MVFYFHGTKVEETESKNVSEDKGTVVFECTPEDGAPFAVTIERRGDEYINTAKGLVGNKVDEPEKFEEALQKKAKEILDS